MKQQASSKKTQSSLQKKSTVFLQPAKVSAFLLILALAAADVFAMVEMFGKLNANPVEQYVYGMTFAICLEGLPTFMGICFSRLKDHSKYKKNDYTNAKIGTVIGLVGLLIAFSMVIYLRWLVISGNGGYEAFKLKEYGAGLTEEFDPSANGAYIKDLFLLCSPIMTSILAFITSWVVFPSNNHAQLERELDILYLDFLDKQSEFDRARNKLEVERMNIWKDIAGNDTDMPRSINVFRKESYNRIRNLLIRDCVEKYPSQIDRYNISLKKKLGCILKEMSEYTTVKEEFDDIKLDELIQQYDEEMLKKIEEKETIRDKSDCWDYSIAKEDLLDSLKRLLNNAVSVAQYKSSSEQHFKEGNKW